MQIFECALSFLVVDDDQVRPTDQHTHLDFAANVVSLAGFNRQRFLVRYFGRGGELVQARFRLVNEIGAIG
jgi:hypothetical protein